MNNLKIIAIISPLALSVYGLIFAIVSKYLYRWQFFATTPNDSIETGRYLLEKFTDSHGLGDEAKFRYENLRTKINGFFLYRYHLKKLKKTIKVA